MLFETDAYGAVRPHDAPLPPKKPKPTPGIPESYSRYPSGCRVPVFVIAAPGAFMFVGRARRCCGRAWQVVVVPEMAAPVQFRVIGGSDLWFLGCLS